MVWEYGEDLADKSYLFADPFSRPWLKKDGRLVTPEDDSTPGVLNDRTADGVP